MKTNNYNIRLLLTFDGWKASNQKEYISVNIYFINHK